MSSFCPLTFELPRRRQRRPRLNGVVTAVLRPIALERFHNDLRGLGREHPFGANFGEVPYGGAFERQAASLVTEERGNRLALNFSDRFMIRQDGEDWHQGVSPQIRKVVHVGVYDSPGKCQRRPPLWRFGPWRCRLVLPKLHRGASLGPG